MNLPKIESQTRDSVDDTLNQLQTATLLLAQVEIKIAELGSALQNLSIQVEEFVVPLPKD